MSYWSLGLAAHKRRLIVFLVPNPGIGLSYATASTYQE